MKEYPILFSGPMVRAILEGRKTVTRRIDVDRWLKRRKGDRLWVKETWRPSVAHSHGMNTCDCGDVNVLYASDGSSHFFEDGDIYSDWTIPKAANHGNVTPLFMPRWASRVLLDLTEDPHEERLQDITEEEARAEGVRPIWEADLRPDGELYGGPSVAYRAGFHDLWDSINAKRGHGWDTNRRVAVARFRRVTA